MSQDQRVCGKCGSELIIPRVYIKDRGEGYHDMGLTAVVDENPNAMVFRNPCEVPLRANICASCGFAELYAESPGALWRAYEKATGKRG